MLVFHNRQEVPTSDQFDFVPADSLKYGSGRTRRDGTEAINSALTIRYAEVDGDAVKAYVNLSLAHVYPEIGNRHARGILLLTEEDVFEGRISQATWRALKSFAKVCSTGDVQGNGASRSLVLESGNMQYHLTVEFPADAWFGIEIDYVAITETSGYTDSYQIIEFALEGIEVSAPVSSREAVGLSKIQPFGKPAATPPAAMAPRPVAASLQRRPIPSGLNR